MIAAGQVKPPGAPGGPPAGAAGPAAGGEEAAARPADLTRKGQEAAGQLRPAELQLADGESSSEPLVSLDSDEPGRNTRDVHREGDVIKVKVYAYEVHRGSDHQYIRTYEYDARTGQSRKVGKWIDITRINEELARIQRTLDKAFPKGSTSAALEAGAKRFGEANSFGAGRVTGKEDPPGKKPKVETK